jgi:hypothetical protein
MCPSRKVCKFCHPGKPCRWHGGKFRPVNQMRKQGQYLKDKKAEDSS